MACAANRLLVNNLGMKNVKEAVSNQQSSPKESFHSTPLQGSIFGSPWEGAFGGQGHTGLGLLCGEGSLAQGEAQSRTQEQQNSITLNPLPSGFILTIHKIRHNILPQNPWKQHRTSVKPSVPSLSGPSEGLKERFLIKWRAISPSDISAGAFKLQMFPLWKKSLYNAALLVILMEAGRGKGVRNRKQERLQAVVLIHRWWTAWGYQLCVFAQLLTWPRENKDHLSSPGETCSCSWKDKANWTALKLAGNTVSLQHSKTNPIILTLVILKNVLQETLVCNICIVTELLR